MSFVFFRQKKGNLFCFQNKQMNFIAAWYSIPASTLSWILNAEVSIKFVKRRPFQHKFGFLNTFGTNKFWKEQLKFSYACDKGVSDLASLKRRVAPNLVRKQQAQVTHFSAVK